MMRAHPTPGLSIQRGAHGRRRLDALEARVIAAAPQLPNQEPGVPLAVFDNQQPERLLRTHGSPQACPDQRQFAGRRLSDAAADSKRRARLSRRARGKDRPEGEAIMEEELWLLLLGVGAGGVAAAVNRRVMKA